MSAPYLPPVDRLLRLGDQGRDYRVLGLAEEHVPELLRMAADRALGGPGTPAAQAYARFHAWRALGQLADPRAAEPLVALLAEEYRDDEAFEVLPQVLGRIGPAALPDLRVVLADPTAADDLRIAAANGIAEIGHEHPAARGEAVEALTWQLRSWADESELLNAYLVAFLTDLQATGAAPLMKAAFEAGAVDERVCGDWEEAQVGLGLLRERITASPWDAEEEDDGPGAAPRPVSAAAKAQEKKRRKAARASRKRNRKRK